MVSARAESDYEDLREAGLVPTFRDAVRLNALALAVERERCSFALSELPRVAFLGSAAFREPTVGSEIWIAAAARLFDEADADTYLMLRAFSLSRDQSALPDPADEKRTLAEMEAFRDSLAFATISQIAAAVGYAMHGFRHDRGEAAAKRKDGGDRAEDGGDTLCYEVGLLRQGMAYRLGSAADLKGLPPEAMREMLARAMSRDHGCDMRRGSVSRAEDDYLRTLDEIAERCKAERAKTEGAG